MLDLVQGEEEKTTATHAPLLEADLGSVEGGLLFVPTVQCLICRGGYTSHTEMVKFGSVLMK